jgi:hypothetical protein
MGAARTTSVRSPSPGCASRSRLRAVPQDRTTACRPRGPCIWLAGRVVHQRADARVRRAARQGGRYRSEARYQRAGWVRRSVRVLFRGLWPALADPDVGAGGPWRHGRPSQRICGRPAGHAPSPPECAAFDCLVRGGDVLQPETVHWQLGQGAARPQRPDNADMGRVRDAPRRPDGPGVPLHPAATRPETGRPDGCSGLSVAAVPPPAI